MCLLQKKNPFFMVLFLCAVALESAEKEFFDDFLQDNFYLTYSADREAYSLELFGGAMSETHAVGGFALLQETEEEDSLSESDVGAEDTTHSEQNTLKTDHNTACLSPSQGDDVCGEPKQGEPDVSEETCDQDDAQIFDPQRQIYEASVQRFAKDQDIRVGEHSAQTRKLLIAWSKYRGEWFSVPYIIQNFSDEVYQDKKGALYYIKKLLLLVFHGVPIEYDKDTQKMMFLQDKKDILTPQPDENIWTLLYDCYMRYKKHLCVRECAYYAHQYGYWQNGFHWHGGSQKTFEDYLESCRWGLVVWGFIPKNVLSLSWRDDAPKQIDLWKRVVMDQKVYEVDRYGSYVTQEDLDDMRSFLEFSKTDKYQILKKHVDNHPSEDFGYQKLENIIHECLRKQPLSLKSLKDLCLIDKNCKAVDFWPAVHHLASRKKLGHLVYDAQNSMFHWERGSPPIAQQEDFLIRVFQMDGQQPKIILNAMVTVLKQEGFSCSGCRDVIVGLRSFMLLGIKKIEKLNHVTLQRQYVNWFLDQGITSEEKPPEDINTQKLGPWDIRACRSMLHLVHDKSILRLLQFLGVQIVCPAHPSQAKGHMGEVCSGVEEIIKTKLPALYSILKQQLFEENHPECESVQMTPDEPQESPVQDALKAYEDVAECFEKDQVILTESLDLEHHTLLRAWAKKRDEWIAVQELFPTLLGAPYEVSKGPLFYIKIAIDLALNGVPIVYDKEEQKLMLVKGKKDILTPQPGESILTLIYDLYERHEEDLSIEECAYYAHEYGYWQREFSVHGGVKSQFYSYLECCIWRLVVLDFIPQYALPQSLQQKAQTQANLWQRVVLEKKVDEAEHYGPCVTQEDVKSVKELFEFSKTGAYEVLKKYVLSYKTQGTIDDLKRCIRDNVFAGYCSKKDLVTVCRKEGLNINYFWFAVQRLVCEEGPGRVLYDHECGHVFRWDKGSRPVAQQKNYLTRIFQLFKKPHEMSISLVTTILRQEGFITATETDVYIAHHGFVLLGLTAHHKTAYQKRGHQKRDRDLSTDRRFVNFILLNKTIFPAPSSLNVAHFKTWDKRLCYRIASFVKNGQVFYLLRDCGALKEDDFTPGAPPRKRQKPNISGPVSIIKEEMPALYDILCEQFLQEKESLVSAVRTK